LSFNPHIPVGVVFNVGVFNVGCEFVCHNFYFFI